MSDDRLANGRFAKGNRVSVGNKGGRPKRSTEDAYLAAIRNALPPGLVQELLTEAVGTWRNKPETRARGELLKLLTLALGYAVGKPIERVVTKTERDANLDRYFSTLADAVRDADHGNGSSDADTDN